MIALVAAVLCLRPTEMQVFHVDICELNHVINWDGTEQLAQWIWLDYDWHLEHGWDYYVRDWRIAKEVPEPVGGVQEWDDKKTGRRLRVTHRVFRETWSFGDVEVKDRERVSHEERRRFGQ